MMRSRADTLALRALVAVVGFFCAAGLYRVLTVLFLRVPLDPNEGWNAYHAAAAMGSASLYPAPNALFVNNYPPLSFYLVGALGSLIGDNIVAGRIVSLAAFVCAFVLIISIARRMRLGLAPSLIGGLFFVSVLLLFSDYVGMDDPQLLGHALQLAALFVLLREPRGRESILLCAVLFVVSLFVKHNLVVLPLAALIWLAAKDRANALKPAVACFILGAVGLVWFRVAVGSSLFDQLASPREWSLANAGIGLKTALAWAAPPLVGIGYSLYAGRSERYLGFCAIYAGLAVLIGTLSAGGAGVDANAYFDLVIALALSVGLMLERLELSGSPVSPAAALIFIPIALSLYAALDADWYTYDFWLHPWADEARTAEADIAFLRGEKGDALCETLSLCYWAGKPQAVDVFNLGQAYATGSRSDLALVERVAHRDFAVIEYESLGPFQLTPGVLATTKQFYELKRVSDDGVFFLPRRPRTTSRDRG